VCASGLANLRVKALSFARGGKADVSIQSIDNPTYGKVLDR
jgi:Tfp pilus assembly protein PilX